MKKKFSKGLLIIFLIIIIFFLFFTSIGVIAMSEDDMTIVLFEFYEGNGQTNTENGYAPTRVGDSDYISSYNHNYDATNVGGDSGTLYGKIDVGSIYQNAKNYNKQYWTGLVSYFYNETIGKDNVTVKNLTPITEEAYVTIDVMVSPDTTGSAHYVDLDTYYIVLGSDFGWDGSLNNVTYSCIPLSNYYSQQDIGTFKTIRIQLSEFKNTELDGRKDLIGLNKTWGINIGQASYNYSRTCAVGVVCYNDKFRSRDTYNHLYLDNMGIIYEYQFSADEWNIIPNSPPHVIKGSALDLSYMNDAPAGKHGFIQVDENGDYYFQDKPDEKVKFYGSSLTSNAVVDCKREQAEKIADRLASMGYNVVRLHCFVVIRDWVQGIINKPTFENNTIVVTLNEAKLDNLDYLIAELKKRGIYISFEVMLDIPLDGIPSLSSYDMPSSCLALFFPDAMHVWKSIANQWLNHVNPYTGLALKDDPVVVGVSPWNEAIIYNTKLDDNFRGWLNNDFNIYLAGKGIAPRTITSNRFFDENAETRKYLLEYYTEKTLAGYDEMRGYLKEELNIKAPIGGFNMINNSLLNLWRSYADVHETHLYNGLLNGESGSSFSFYPGAHPRLSAVFAPESKANFVSIYNSRLFQQYLPGLALTQLYNKPFMLSEYTQEFPTKGREDVGMMVAAVGAYNGWDMLNRYTWGHFPDQIVNGTILGGGQSGGATFELANDALGIFSEIQGGLVFRKSNLIESEPKFVIVRSKDWVKTHEESLYNLNSEENMMYLTHLFKTVVVYSDEPSSTLQRFYKITPDLTMDDIESGNIPSENRLSITNQMTLKEVAQTYINSLDDTKLKARMLSQLNENRLVSDTGELIFDLNLNTYFSNTPYMVGAAGTLNNNNYTLGAVTLKGDIDKGTMSATSLDDKPLDRSNRILIIYTTDVAATGEKFIQDESDSRKMVYHRGFLPTLIKNHTAEFKVKSKLNLESYKAYKLDMHGNRIDEIPVCIEGNTIIVQLETDAGFAFELINNSTISNMVKVNTDIETKRVTVKGTNEFIGDNLISLMVIDKLTGNIKYLNQTKRSGHNEFFDFGFRIDESNIVGEYILKLGAKGRESAYNTEFYLTTDSTDIIVKEVVFTDSKDNFIDNLYPYGKQTISINVSMFNNTGDEINPCVIAALYDSNDKLIEMVVNKNETLDKNETRDANLSMKLPEEVENSYIKVFIWNDVDGLIPLAKKQCFYKHN